MRSALVTSCLLVAHIAAIEAATPIAVSIDSTGWEVNGQTSVPLGLFGLHAVHLTPELVADLGIECYRQIEFVPGGGSKYDTKNGELQPIYEPLSVLIDCQGDRFYEPLVLRHDDWAERCATYGRSYGELWRRLTERTGKQGIVQWWNEPYLNWAERSAGSRGSTIQARYYDLSRAVAGGPVHIKGRDEPLRYFRWRNRWPVRYEERTNKHGETFNKRIIGWSIDIPPGLSFGDHFDAAERRYWRNRDTHTWTIEEHWYPEDPTRVSFWSGRQNRDFYLMMYGPWAKALRQANPEVTILGGWDFNYSAGDWATWVELYRPLLAAYPDHIDGITEHHYGVPPAVIQAWYEVGTGDAWAITGRWLKNWNTECQGRLDPAVYGRSSNASGGSAGEQALWEANYNLADIIGLAARMPAKIGSRTVHNFAGKGFADCGAAWALRLLKPLRGKLRRVSVGDPRIWAVAADHPDGPLVLAVYNHGRDAASLALQAGSATAVTRQRLALADEQLTIDTANIDLEAGAWQDELASRHAVVYLIDGCARTGLTTRQQFFPREGALRRYGGKPKWPLSYHLDLGETDPATISAATLRLVDAGDGTLHLGGKTIAIKRQGIITDIAIDPSLLSPGVNELNFVGDAPDRIAMASLLLDWQD